MPLIWVAVLTVKRSADLPVMTKIAAELGQRVAPFRSWSWGSVENKSGVETQLCVVGEIFAKGALTQIDADSSVREARETVRSRAVPIFEGILETPDEFPALPPSARGATYIGITQFREEVSQERRDDVKARILEYGHALPDIKEGYIGWCNRDMGVPFHLTFVWHFTSKEGVQRYFRNPLHGPLYTGVRDTFQQGFNTHFSSRSVRGEAAKIATDDGVVPYRHLQILRPKGGDSVATALQVQARLRDPELFIARAVTAGTFTPSHILSNAEVSSSEPLIGVVVDLDNPTSLSRQKMDTVLQEGLHVPPANARVLSVDYTPLYPRLLHVLPIANGRVQLVEPVPRWDLGKQSSPDTP